MDGASLVCHRLLSQKDTFSDATSAEMLGQVRLGLISKPTNFPEGDGS